MKDDQQLETALERFDTAMTSFEKKQDGKIGELLERIEDIEAAGAVGGQITGKSNSRRREAERKGMRDFALGRKFDDAVISPYEGKAMNLTGEGILAPEILSAEIEKYEKDTMGLAQLVRRIPLQTGDFKINTRVTPPVASWIGESGSRAVTDDPLYRQAVPVGAELYANLQASNWLIQDAQYPLEREWAMDVVDQMQRALDNSILNGTGSTDLRGILNTTPVTTADFASPLRDQYTIQSVGAPSPDSLLDHMMDAFFALNAAYRRGATWVMNSTTLAEVRKLKGTDGHPVFAQNFAVGQDAADGFLLGKPVIVSEFMPDLGASPLSYPIIVGDWQAAYTLCTIGTPTLIRDNITTLGQTKLYWAQRHIGTLVNNDALKAVNR